MIRLRILIQILLLGTLSIIKTETFNYCASGLCPQGKPHIACGHDGRFSSLCPSNVEMVDMDPYKELILKLHNARRNLIASGKLKGYKGATRMAVMQWDNELAEIAAYNVKQCEMKHDQCRNTQKFSKSGQNLALIGYTGSKSSKTNKELIKNRVTAWWKEFRNCKMSTIRKYPSNYSGPAIGHFTVFVAEKNVRVGCAAIRYTNGKIHNFLIGCNYATTNIVGRPIYTDGVTGKECKTGRDKEYKSLCSKNEKYDGL